MLLTYSDTKRTLMHLFLFTNSTQGENWFQYVRRVYATAINFPCITTLHFIMHSGDKRTNYKTVHGPQWV